MFFLLCAFTFITTGCSLRCITACGEPEPQGCYRELYLFSWIGGGIGIFVLLFSFCLVRYQFYLALSAPLADLPPICELTEFYVERLRVRTNAVSSQATICAGAMFFGLLTLNTGHMNGCSKLFDKPWYPKDACLKPIGVVSQHLLPTFHIYSHFLSIFLPGAWDEIFHAFFNWCSCFRGSCDGDLYDAFLV
jgi:hypothetical protein